MSGGAGAVRARRAGYPFSFRCRRSGNCCARPAGVVRVDAAEVRAMARELGLSEPGFRRRFVAPGGDRLVQGLGGRYSTSVPIPSVPALRGLAICAQAANLYWATRRIELTNPVVGIIN